MTLLFSSCEGHILVKLCIIWESLKYVRRQLRCCCCSKLEVKLRIQLLPNVALHSLRAQFADETFSLAINAPYAIQDVEILELIFPYS